MQISSAVKDTVSEYLDKYDWLERLKRFDFRTKIFQRN